LLGLRGPLSTLIRNLLWLLAFNAIYLGIFAFVPRTFGSIVYSGLFNTTVCSTLLHQLPYFYSENSTDVTFLSMISDLKEESARVNTTFRLPDLATVTLGYLSIALVIVLVRYGWIFTHKIRNRLISEGGDAGMEREQGDGGAVFGNNRLRHERVRDVMHFGGGFDDRDPMEPPEAAASVVVTMALDATVAVVKVGILLFLKMFLLPLLLGLWLDTSTMSLFGNTLSDRILYAGRDLFSFILLHWVAGITFMLLVTVFLLQLREVAHPDLLARLIRPQEPQPDLLGNLMHESVSTHMKRLFLSLAIYAPLLTILVAVPVTIFVASGLSNYVPFFQLHFWHLVVPQMQIPLELIIFHLTMLALLEKYKNTIGELQHHWLVFMCRRMGLTDHILPQSIDKFKLIGTKEIFAPKDGSASTRVDQVDPFWYELAKKDSDLDDFILSNIEKASSGTPTFLEGESKPNGEKVLSKFVNYILLPQQATVDSNLGMSRTGSQNLLATKIGRYRLCVRDASVIEFWGEVPGKEVARPPEGWDDLGAGGAYVQGRWAWGKERRSIVEGSVAQRTPFRATERQRRPFLLMLKVTVLLFFSWVAITITVLGIVSAPLAVGRSIYFLFRVPQDYVHDPLAFCIGGCLFFPMASTLLSTFTADRDDIGLFARLARWASRFHLPPTQKFVVFMESMLLWFAAAPMALGVSYELIAVKRGQWYSGDEELVDIKSLCLCWMVGTVVLNSWAFLAYFSVFTREFWANIGNGILEPPPDENDGGFDRARARQNGLEAQGVNGEPQLERLLDHQRLWQGKEGRVARFFKVWKAVFFEWEWDAIDHVVLLGDFALPISKQSVAALVGSSFSFLTLVYVSEACLEVEGAAIISKCFGQVVLCDC
jgi:E3 ubiquitin-protein ligase MARCH6